MRWWFALLVLVLGILRTQPVGAVPRPNTRPRRPVAPPNPVAPANEEQARSHFARGVVLFEEEAWDAAAAEFMKSRELLPTRAATKNAAICYLRLHRFDESLDLFELLVATYPDLKVEDLRLAQREVAALAARVGTLAIVNSAAGASIVVDGRLRGTTPAPPLRVSAGSHVLRVVKEGFMPFEARVEVVGGQTANVRVELPSLVASGQLKVTEQGQRNLTVIIDNAPVGTTPWEGVLGVGEHVVVLRGEGDLGTPPASIPVRKGQETVINLQAEELDSTLRIEPTPHHATVAIDGITIGRGIWEGRLRAGSHRIEASAEGFLIDKRQAELEQGGRRNLTLVLERDPASPMWADQTPPLIVLEVQGGGGFTPTVGGGAVDNCSLPCTTSHVIGALALAQIGYQLRVGLGFGLEAGYFSFGEDAQHRSIAAHHPPGPDTTVVASDVIRWSGAMIGGNVSVRLGKVFPLTLRFNTGVLLGNVKDQRDLTSSASSGGGASLDPVARAQNYLYFAPEARVALRFLERIEVSLGLNAIIARVITDAHWPADEQLGLGAGSKGTFDADRLIGKTVLTFAPALGLRYELRSPLKQ